jgi:hypothetical protein
MGTMLSFYDLFDCLWHLLYHLSWPKGHDCVMIREEPREFGITMVARPLLWAYLGKFSWEEEGHSPLSPFLSITFPFGALQDYMSPEKRHVISSLPSCTEP